MASPARRPNILRTPTSPLTSLKEEGTFSEGSSSMGLREDQSHGRQPVLNQRGRVVVLYIAGWGRSGSTIIGNALGQLPGFAHVGEVSNVWARGVIENSLCGCGARFSECATWSQVFTCAFGGIDVEHAKRMKADTLQLPNNKALLLRAATGRDLSRDNPDADARGYTENLCRLYGAIGSEMGARVIVDSSKVPSYAIALASLPNVDLRVVHLVRDPRATSYSWSRHIDRPDAGRPLTMERLETWQSAARWCSWNATTEVITRLLGRPTVRVSYEQFVRDPRTTLSTILGLVGDVARVDRVSLPFVSDHEVELGPTHTVWGNHRRRRAGRVLIESDEEWKANLTRFERAVIAAMTFPLARLYGYYHDSPSG
jgi:hypothetical protein